MNTATDVALRLTTMAHQFAQQVERGLAGLTPDERCDLRMLPIEMLGMRDELLASTQPPRQAGGLRLVYDRRWGQQSSGGTAA